MAEEFKACSMDECNGNAHWRSGGKKGFCQKHYARVWRHGDPAALLKTPNGEVQRYMSEVVLVYEGSDCLVWGYARDAYGYGIFGDGHAHPFVCERVNGHRPSPNHDAAHSCGNGHEGCVTPRHLSWKTRAENMADKLIHGTHKRGERCNFAKLTEDQAREILALKGKKTQAGIASLFGVSRVTISDIHRGKRWSWLQE